MRVPPTRPIPPPDRLVAIDRPQSVTAIAAITSLQRRVGNQGFGALMRRVRERPATVSLTVVPRRRLSGAEFSALVSAQLHGITAEEASARRDDLRGTDPHFLTGVSASEVGKPIRVDIVPPELGEGEAEDVRARAKQFSGLDETDRHAIDDEANRRFWSKHGVAAGTKPTDAADRRLWMSTRDQVVRDRNRLDALPAALRGILMPGDKRPAPDQYAAGLRLGDKFMSLSAADWALYERRGGAVKGSYSTLEAAVDRFTSQQAADRKIVERVRGTEKLWRLVLEFRVAQSMGMTKKQYPLWPRYKTMLAQLAADGFNSVPEYEIACGKYLELFRSRARELTMLALSGSEKAVRAELSSGSDTRKMTAMFTSLAKVRKLLAEADEAVQMYDSLDKKDAAKAERARLVAQYPILADPKLPLEDLSAATPAELGTVVRRTANDRLDDIRKTRRRVEKNPDVVLQLDRVVALAHAELGAGEVGEKIVQARIDEIQNAERFEALTLAILAIGLGMLTFGGGTVAVLAGTASLGVSVYQAHDELEKYADASAAAHTSFDPAQSVSSKDPTVLWVALSLVGVGLEGAALGRALALARPAIKVLETTGDTAKFAAKLAEATELSPAVQNALKKSAAAERDFEAAFRRARQSLNLGMNGGDPTILQDIFMAAFHAARIGVRKFEVFLEMLKSRAAFAKALGFDSLEPWQKEMWKRAFKDGVAKFDAGRPALTVPSAKTASKLTFADEMLLNGKPMSVAQRNDVIKRLGLAHADKGHGAGRDVRTIANEAFQNDIPGSPNPGMSGIWASDEMMLKSAQMATAMRKAGLGKWNAARRTWTVDFAETPNAGRVFMVRHKVPADVTPVALEPVPGIPVVEVPANNVRAYFQDGKIVSIFPSWVPNPQPRPLTLDVE